MAVPVAIDPGRLVAHARELARHQGGAGRPRPIWLRRSISAAYYAVFHAFALHVAAQVLPQGSVEDWQRLTRSIDHSALRDVCRWVAGDQGAGKEHVQPIIATLQTDPEIRQVASITFRLQEARHLADYDHLAPFDKALALSFVDQAEWVVDRLEALATTQALEKLVALIALRSKLR